MTNSIVRVTSFVKSILSSKIKKGDVVIDGTMGNGHDTMFLAELVGCQGIVYSFDIQTAAIENTRKRISDSKSDMSNIRLIKDSHENINQYVNEKVDGVMFNLGYLPGGDPDIITRPNSTIKAISQAIDLLKPGGIISLIVYYGHKGGIEEKDKVLGFLRNISREKICVVECNYSNYENNPPIVVLIEKNKGF